MFSLLVRAMILRKENEGSSQLAWDGVKGHDLVFCDDLGYQTIDTLQGMP